MENKFKSQTPVEFCGVTIFAHNTILDLGVGYISYARDLHETAVVLKGADGLGTIYMIVDGDKRKEVEKVIEEYSQDKWLKEGLFGEVLAWACQHPDLNVARSSIGRLNSRCDLKSIKPVIVIPYE